MVKGKNNIGKPQSGIRAIIAFCIILLGLWYPELVKANILGSLLLSPLGVVPCPTLITTLGLLNLFYPDVNNKQFMVTVFFGIVYGLIGTFKLGVHFDLCLLGAAIYSIFNMIIVKHVIGFTGNVGNPAL